MILMQYQEDNYTPQTMIFYFNPWALQDPSNLDFLLRKMLVFNCRYFLLNVLIWTVFILGIKIRTVLKSELNGLHENVQNCNP